MFAGPAVPGARRPGPARAASPSLDLYRPRRTRSGCRGRTSSAPRSTCASSRSCARAGFPEPYAFSLRAHGCSRARRDDFDLVHDNQCLGRGLLGHDGRDGWPFVTTLHHPITVDRDLDLGPRHRPVAAHSRCGAGTASCGCRCAVARQIPRHSPCRRTRKQDIAAQMGVDTDTLHVVPVGVDQSMFRPLPARRAGPGSAHDDRQRRRAAEGPRAAARGAGQGPHRARRRAPRRHRPPEPQEPDPRADRRLGPHRRGRVRERRHRRARSSSSTPRPRSPSCRRCTRGSRCRRSRRWRAACRSSPPPAARCRRSSAPTARPALTRPARRPVGAGGRDPAGAGRPRAAGPARRGRPGAGCSTGSPGASTAEAHRSSTTRRSLDDQARDAGEAAPC